VEIAARSGGQDIRSRWAGSQGGGQGGRDTEADEAVRAAAKVAARAAKAGAVVGLGDGSIDGYPDGRPVRAGLPSSPPWNNDHARTKRPRSNPSRVPATNAGSLARTLLAAPGATTQRSIGTDPKSNSATH